MQNTALSTEQTEGSCVEHFMYRFQNGQCQYGHLLCIKFRARAKSSVMAHHVSNCPFRGWLLLGVQNVELKEHCHVASELTFSLSCVLVLSLMSCFSILL